VQDFKSRGVLNIKVIRDKSLSETETAQKIIKIKTLKLYYIRVCGTVKRDWQAELRDGQAGKRCRVESKTISSLVPYAS
jgi:hypothetical protein